MTSKLNLWRCLIFHRNFSFIFRARHPSPYKACLTCTREYEYNMQTMKLGKQLPGYVHKPFDGTEYGWERDNVQEMQ
jgi:hypothetical protein